MLRAYLAEPESKETSRHVERLALEMQRSVALTAESWLSMAYAAAMENEEGRCEDLVHQAMQLGHPLKELYQCLLFAYARKRGARSLKAERAFRDLVALQEGVTEAVKRYLRMATPEAEALMQELGVEKRVRQPVRMEKRVSFRVSHGFPLRNSGPRASLT